MVRLFFILVALAVLVWFGQRYFMDHPGGSSFWDIFGSHMETQATPTPGPGGASTPTDHTIDGCRSRLAQIEQKILSPLDQNKDIDPVVVLSTLKEINTDLADNRFERDYKNLTQAIVLLGQAVAERSQYLKRYHQDDARQGSGPTTSIKGATMQSNSSALSPSFFKDAAVRDWNARCDAYRISIDRLLVPSPS